ncbi:hypothetical protein, partial [Escherichia coli]|uniref:hypothetical protein n=1 Tax=Escherichia coli TaxID=562 RepID=UPI003F69C0CC
MVLALAIKAASRAKVVRFRGQAVDAFGPVYRARQWLAHSGIDMVLAPSITIEAEVRRLRLPAPVVCVPLGV